MQAGTTPAREGNRDPLRTGRTRRSVRGLARLGCLVLACSATAQANQQAPLQPVAAGSVNIEGGLLGERLDVHRRVTLPAVLDHLERSGRLANFDALAAKREGGHRGLPQDDADVYRAVEAVAHVLALGPDSGLEKRADAICARIVAAQDEDGYLHTQVQLERPDQRWIDVEHGYELFCAGHLIEAGIAWFEATGRRPLLDAAVRLADLIDAEFGPKKRLDPPGHQGLELALLRLERATGEARYGELARFFVGQRGISQGRKMWGKFAQDHEPVRLQREAVGNAVRAMYQACAATELAATSGDRGMRTSLQTLWQDVAGSKMYVTGGIGSSRENEASRAPTTCPTPRPAARPAPGSAWRSGATGCCS